MTTAGAEVIEPWLNYNYSRSFLFGLAIPFTHTGVMLTYPITDKLTVSGAGIAGWDNVGRQQRQPELPRQRRAESDRHGVRRVDGHLGSRAELEDRQQADPRRPRPHREAVRRTLTLVGNYDYAVEEHANIDGNQAIWQGFSLIANYQFTDRFDALRGEWFEDHGGSRTGVRQTLYEGTATAKYLITQHLYGQLEVRRDNGSKKTFEDDSSLALASGQTTYGFAVGWVFN